MNLANILGLITIVISTLVSTTSFAGGKDPLGQKADYLLDKNSSRTSNMIKSGTVQASVAAFHESTNAGPAYEVHLDYHFKVSLAGNQDGTEQVLIEKEFFTPEFMIKFREEKHYEGDNFKADHLGYADAKNMDGKFYPHCDKILLYDLKKPPQFMTELFSTILNVDRAEIQDLKAIVHAYAGIPVLGGAKIDISGKYSGMNIKAGVDYVAP